MFVYKDKTPYCIYTSKQTFEKHVHLLHLSNFKNSHYVLIKDFESFSVLLPEEGVYINFQKFQRFTKEPFIIYGDFECILIFLTDNIGFGPKTKKYQDHTVCSNH